jgi:hypothetical protein
VPVVPNTSQPGYLFVAQGNGQNSGYWTPLTDSKDFSIFGTVVATTGAANQYGPYRNNLQGQLLQVAGKVLSGSLNLDIQQNGTGITGLTSLAFTTTDAVFTPTNTTIVSVSDYLGPYINSVSSAEGLQLSFLFWVYL